MSVVPKFSVLRPQLTSTAGRDTMLLVRPQSLHGRPQRLLLGRAGTTAHSMGLYGPQNGPAEATTTRSDFRSHWNLPPQTRSCLWLLLWAILRPLEANRVGCRTSVTWTRPLGPSVKALRHYQEHRIGKSAHGVTTHIFGNSDVMSYYFSKPSSKFPEVRSSLGPVQALPFKDSFPTGEDVGFGVHLCFSHRAGRNK